MMAPVPDSPRSRSRELPTGPRTAAEARLFIAEAIEGFAVEVDVDAVHLLTSELASNAVRHGKGADRHECLDGGSGPPRVSV